MNAEDLIIDREIGYVMEVEERSDDGATCTGYRDEEVDGSQVLIKVKELIARGMRLEPQTMRSHILLRAKGCEVTFGMTLLRPQVGFMAAVQCLDCRTVHNGEVVGVDNEAERFTIRPIDEAHELHEDAWTQIVHLDV
ncbi:hypothetical protein ABZT26_25800 [Streptomyces sp. NPDC005395]|uniref:hypothetical protein n=1 Tax=Streptomyces sp. NPDC005395 TaxID=3157042 RepID=UPI0033BE31DB